MSVVLNEPRTVLVVAGSDERRDRLSAVVEDADGVDGTKTADSVGQLADGWGKDDSIGCVVTTDDLPDGDPVAVVEAVREHDPDLPVVVSASDGDVESAGVATAAGATAYLPGDDDEKRLRETVGTAVDDYVRRRIAAEDSDMFRTFLEEAHIPLYVKDEQGRHLRIAEIPGGEDPEEAIGKTDLELYGETGTGREAYEDDMHVIEEGEALFDQDEQFGDGEIQYWSRTTKIPWRDDDGEVKGLVGVSRDITEFKLREQELAELRNQFDEFASQLSHDLQTPLQVADGYLELARQGDESAIEEARDALERMEETINDLGQLARQRGPAGTPEPLSLKEVVAEVWEPLESGDATLEFDAPSETEIRTVRQAIRPLLENLFKNAVQHAGDDVQIEVGVHGSGFYVADDGPGIPEAEREKVLEEGYTTSEEGSGTGLSMVRSIAQQNHWEIDVGENDAGGARFDVKNCQVIPDPAPRLELGDPIPIDEEDAVGELREPGVAEYDGDDDRWRIVGDGEDIFRQHNDFYFAYATVDGPVSIQARMLDIEHVNEYSKGGLMIRDGLEEAASYGYVGRTPEHGTELLWRHDWGADGLSQQLEEGDRVSPWYRIDRVGDRVTTFVSTDGDTWEAVDQRTVPLEDPIHVGLVVSSVVPGRPAEATFESVSVNRLDV